VPASVWYGGDDVLGPPAHAEYLITTISGAERHELSGGHVLDESDVAAVYDWLAYAVRW
jgi:hypothetical protein